MTNEHVGARFLDANKRDRGWASRVTRRERSLHRLVVLDVTSTDAALRTFLGSLDRAPLTVQPTGDAADIYTFVWASGYDNGATIRIQGRLQEP
jgi:hypothetical protein